MFSRKLRSEPALFRGRTALNGTIVAPSLQGVLGALISLIAIFLPGVLVLIGALPLWEALYNPIWTSAVKAPVDFGLALTGFVLLIVLCAPPLIVVLISAAGGVGLQFLP